MHDTLPFLTGQPGALPGKIVLLRERAGELVELESHYAVEAYDRSLFDAYEIDFPPALAKAVPKRQSEFLAGRILARAALERLHRPAASIAPGEGGSPLWPGGVSGSISHSHGKCVCLAVAGAARLVGIDVEKVPAGDGLRAILQEALDAEERERVFQQTHLDAAIAATLVFSAKETLYKALYPIVREFFGFDAAIFNAICGGDILSLSIARPLHPSIPCGKEISIGFAIDGEFVRTWAVLERGTLHFLG